jgi:Putative abortive phage resistance protein AbiGi, antitoxin
VSLISSNTLFHFTGSLENLIGILINEFRPRLSVESFDYVAQHLPLNSVDRESGIPMVCFCDIPLSQVGRHMEHYGSYGIGLDKDWGIANGVSPVFYTHPRSPGTYSAAQLVALLSSIHMDDASEEQKERVLLSGQLIYFFKRYEGELVRPNGLRAHVRFYDEREWRYIPADIERIPAISRADLADPVKSEEARRLTEALPPLSFEPKDINYIVVEHESEVLPMYYALRTIKAKYDEAAKDTLVTKLISAERIKADF